MNLQPLNYKSPRVADGDEVPLNPVKLAVIFLISGVVLTVPAIVFALLSAGSGEGNYFSARILFPYSMLLTRLTEDTITEWLVGIALVQFPVYGFAIGWTTTHGGRPLLATVCVIFVMHAAAAVLCFLGLLPDFS